MSRNTARKLKAQILTAAYYFELRTGFNHMCLPKKQNVAVQTSYQKAIETVHNPA